METNNQCRFFITFGIYLNFLGKFWYDFCYFDIFSRFSIIFRVCVNVCGIFGIVMIFLWILDLIIYLYFSALFRDRKKFEKNYIYVPCDCVDFSVYLVLILGVLFSVLNFIRLFRCSFYLFLVSLCLCFCLNFAYFLFVNCF